MPFAQLSVPPLADAQHYLGGWRARGRHILRNVTSPLTLPYTPHTTTMPSHNAPSTALIDTYLPTLPPPTTLLATTPSCSGYVCYLPARIYVHPRTLYSALCPCRALPRLTYTLPCYLLDNVWCCQLFFLITLLLGSDVVVARGISHIFGARAVRGTWRGQYCRLFSWHTADAAGCRRDATFIHSTTVVSTPYDAVTT